MKLSDLGEKKLIKRLLKKRDERLDIKNPILTQSYHDDAALIKNIYKYSVISTDMLIEHTHFPYAMTPYQMGSKAVCVNISDILAMNGKPQSILVSLALPSSMSVEDFDSLINGILDTCEMYDTTLIGGDLNTSDEIVICATSTGVVCKPKFLKGIHAGDLVAVTGKLGEPAAAYDLLYNTDIDFPEHEKVINTLLNPTLPYATSKVLYTHPELITSITDITDGLASELGVLMDNNHGIGFNLESIPYNPYIREIAKANNKNISEYLLHFGEEFELLLTLDPKIYQMIKDEIPDIHIIGYADTSGKITFKDKEIKSNGYEHLSGE